MMQIEEPHVYENGRIGISNNSYAEDPLEDDREFKRKNLQLTQPHDEELYDTRNVTPSTLHSHTQGNLNQTLKSADVSLCGEEDAASEICEEAEASVEPDELSSEPSVPGKHILEEEEVRRPDSAVEVTHFPLDRMSSMNEHVTTQNCCCQCHCSSGSVPKDLDFVNETGLPHHSTRQLQASTSLPNYAGGTYNVGQVCKRDPWTMQRNSLPSSMYSQAQVAALVNGNNNHNGPLPASFGSTYHCEKYNGTGNLSSVANGKVPPSSSGTTSLSTTTTTTTTTTTMTRSAKRKRTRGGLARNKGLLALVAMLIIITVSTLAALVYFVVFGNASETSGTQPSSEPPTIPQVEIELNQTMFCGIFPQQYLPTTIDLRSQISSMPFNPLLPINDNRTIRGRVVGSEPANILQYPWQNNDTTTAGSSPTESSTSTTTLFHYLFIKSRVMGGTDAVAGRFPWQVSLWVRGRGMTCGGSILMNNWVLTAAHCTHAKPEAEAWTAYAGVTALTQKDLPPAKKRQIKRIISHEDYKNDLSYDYDVSLMELESPLEFSDFIQPICLPPQGHVFPDGMACYVSGWGALDNSGQTVHPDVLQHAQIDIIGNETCNRPDWLEGLVTDRMLCAGKAQGGRDACQGDSGGPLSCYSADKGVWMLAGSVSWGIECGLPKLPGVYAKTSYFSDWIWTSIGRAEGWIPESSDAQPSPSSRR